MSSPLTWNVFTNNFDYVGTGGGGGGVNSVTGINGAVISPTTGNVVVDGGIFTNAVQTVDGAIEELLTLDLGAVPGTFNIIANIEAINADGSAGAGYFALATYKTDGAVAQFVGKSDLFNEQIAIVPSDALFSASGNNAVIDVLGTVGQTIDWKIQATIGLR